MRPDFYRGPEKFGLKIPTLRNLVAAGASADAVESIYPSTTYPAHATIVTGVPPRVHGVYSHLTSRDPTLAVRPWHWYARGIRVATLWDAARAAGRKTAAISWPVSAGATIDYNVPEIWDPTVPDPHQDLNTVALNSTPGLFEELANALLPTLSDATLDRLRSEAACYLWRRYQPDLLSVHFDGYDQIAHHYGPLSPEALAALEQTDEEIGRLREGVAREGPVTFFVLSDHGFVPVEKEAAPLVILTEEGLFDQNPGGKPKLKRLGAIHSGGSFAIYWLEAPLEEDRRSLARALERLRATGAVAEVLDREKLQALGADPDAEVVLDAAPGFCFSDRFTGPVVQASLKDRGTHGHVPSRPGLEASFVAVGPGITPGKNLGRLSLTQVAPTLARSLGLPPGALASSERPIDLG